MSLIPFLMDLASEIGELNRGLDDNFGFGIYPHEIHGRQPSYGNHRSGTGCWLPPKNRLHPYENLRKKACCAAAMATDIAKPKLQKEKSFDNDDAMNGNGIDIERDFAGIANSIAVGGEAKGFEVSINVQSFKPNELTVKTVSNDIIVEGKHEERADNHGIISRHFLRKYVLPKGYDSNKVVSTLSPDGILTVKAPAPSKPIGETERIIEIQQIEPPQLAAKAAEAVKTIKVAPQSPVPEEKKPIEIEVKIDAEMAEAAPTTTNGNTNSNNDVDTNTSNEEPEATSTATSTASKLAAVTQAQCENGDERDTPVIATTAAATVEAAN